MKNQMQLFTTEPAEVAGLTVRKILANKELPEGADNGLRRVAMVAEGKKQVALRLGIANNKDNAARIEAEVLKANDRLMNLAVSEIIKRRQDNSWTGKNVSIATNKKGTEQTFTVSLKTCDRLGVLPTREQAAKFLATLTEDEQVAVMEESEAMRRSLVVTDLEA